MKIQRRGFLCTGGAVAAGLVAAVSAGTSEKPSRSSAFSGRRFGTIFNNDINNILAASSGRSSTPQEYQRAVYAILDMKPGGLAQNVGMPDPVLYPSSVATSFDRHLEEAGKSLSPIEGTAETARCQADAMRRLRELGTEMRIFPIGALTLMVRRRPVRMQFKLISTRC